MTTTMEATMGNGFVIEVQVDGRWTRNAACLAYAPVYATREEAERAGEELERTCDGSWSAWRVRPADAPIVLSGDLFWDDQDYRCAGWVLRYHNARWVECVELIDGARDASVEELAASIAAETSHESDLLRVALYRRGDQQDGWVKVRNGQVVDWRAL